MQGSGNEIGGLSFSDSVDERARPIGADVDFSPETLRLWVSFNYYDFKPGSRVHYVVKAHGETLMTGDLACCDGPNGRYAFPLEYERDRAFGGAAYEVIIVVAKTEASRGTVRGARDRRLRQRQLRRRDQHPAGEPVEPLRLSSATGRGRVGSMRGMSRQDAWTQRVVATAGGVV